MLSDWACMFWSQAESKSQAGMIMHMLVVSMLSYHSPQSLPFVVALTTVILTCVRLDLIVALICISPVNIDIKNLFCAAWPFTCFVLRNLYFGHLPIFYFYVYIYKHSLSIYIY